MVGGETIRNIIFNLPFALRKSENTEQPIHPSFPFTIHNICIYLYNKSDFPVPCQTEPKHISHCMLALLRKTIKCSRIVNRSSVRSPTSRNVVRIHRNRRKFSLEFHSNAQKTHNQNERVNCYIPSGRTTCQPMTARQQQTIMENNCDGCAVSSLRFPSDDTEKKALPIICYTQCAATFILFFFTPVGLETRKNSQLSGYPHPCDGLQFYGSAGRFHRIEWKKMNKINRSVLFGNSVCRFGVLNFVFVIIFFLLGEFLVGWVFFLQRNSTEPL